MNEKKVEESSSSLKQSNSLLPPPSNNGLLLPTSSGNATGSGRNKVALRPGYSLMGWVRFAATAKDLTGLSGQQTIPLNVTKDELSKHDQPDDCWTAIRDKVYNITPYLDYHPGGMEELMRGAGIDSTDLFDETHAYVNYETLLQKCYIGRLVSNDK
ncbi:hypothetical protein RDWZM_001055 [Blomia tropicalis]|uniref:Cytochrome b5 heme-binding domain-containing protein n=1 Tax=Blomia tropicalis TaxID=40697 RepID=A0A9Q0MAW8_BLOTA|nr:Cytochrome b5 reductase 4 [Blomia tropicalis]KAJ6222510.1 hypothetical protein RDWZM_001055 [Blomia tropicalis]